MVSKPSKCEAVYMPHHHVVISDLGAGEFYVYYCRERNVIDSIAAKAEQRHPGSIPHNYHKRQTEGEAWVVPAQRRRVRDKLRSIFPSAAACFAAFDEDGGGSLSRQELARGLRAHNIFLHPSDLIRWVWLSSICQLMWLLWFGCVG